MPAEARHVPFAPRSGGIPPRREHSSGRCGFAGKLWLLAGPWVMLVCGCQWLAQGVHRRGDESRSLASRAKEAEGRGDWNQAAEFLARAVQRSPADAELHRRLAGIYLQKNNLPRARRHLRAAEAADPQQAETLIAMARLADQLDEQPLAERLLQKALALDAANTEALLLQAALQEREGNPQRAMALYHRVLAAQPENNTARMRLASHQIRSGHPDRAAVLLRAACQCPSASAAEKAAAYRELGTAYSRIGRWNDATTALEHVVRNRQFATADDWNRLAAARREATAALSRDNVAAVFEHSPGVGDSVRPASHQRPDSPSP